MATEQDLLKFYDLNNLENYLSRLGDFGSIEKGTGVFQFLFCKDCKGSLLGHIRCHTKDKTLHWSREQIDLVIKIISENPLFEASMAKFDSRTSVSTCDICEVKLENRSILENHMRIMHKQKMNLERKVSVQQSMLMKRLLNAKLNKKGG